MKKSLKIVSFIQNKTLKLLCFSLKNLEKQFYNAVDTLLKASLR